MKARGTLYALLGAALFGASAPIAKLLLRGSGPLVVAGLLYLGGARLPNEIVVNQINKDQIVGYLSTPKVNVTRASIQ